MQDSLTLIRTSDGSYTLKSELFQQHYHSLHGAIQESEHVFFKEGLLRYQHIRNLRILEVGFGTGLNALLAFKYSKERNSKTDYISYEAFPISIDIAEKLEYGKWLGKDYDKTLLSMHTAPMGVAQMISEEFSLLKKQEDILEGMDEEEVDIVFFDAFSPGSQPELWAVEVFSNLHACMKQGGILTTYCSKGDVRRAMLMAGFKVEKCPGPPGKREMLRAIK